MASPSAEPAEPAEPQLPSFRPGKKRKIYRQRAEDAEADQTPADAAPMDQIRSFISEVQEETSVSEVLRLRNARKARLGGVAFRAGPTGRGEEDGGNTEQGLVLHDGGGGAGGETAVVGGIKNRFAPQTGLVGELVNRHMEEYIESGLAKRQRQRDAAEAAAAANDQSSDSNINNATGSRDTPATTTAAGKPVVAQQPAVNGKLLEIDLGEEVRARNIAETERARRRAEGEVDDVEEADGSRPRKVRLGRDGKPWRGRNRRNSEDVKRDQLVEQFLRENRLDVYDRPAEPQAGSSSSAAAASADISADDQIAEEFRREFMDAMMQRQQRRRPASNAKPVAKGAKGTEEVLKGPKLGGSRNSRAAMRDLLLRQQEGRK